MRYYTLACDYDGPLALNGRVDEDTIAALERLRDSGRTLILVTGRERDELLRVFPRLDLFERVVAENGALLYTPATCEEKALGESPNQDFVNLLRQRGVAPLSVGRVIVATWEPYETVALQAIRDLGLELQVIFNKGAVMILPSGINKASGLKAALSELGLSPHNMAGIGDAENDHAFLTLCECAVAVANALQVVKTRADLVTHGDHGAGVVELIDKLITSDLGELEPLLTRHDLLLGTRADDQEVRLRPYGMNVLLAGTSGSGKSTLTTAFLERLVEHGYQFCIIDPEGDYHTFEGAQVLGDTKRAPIVDEVCNLLAQPEHNVIVNLLGVAIEQRPAFFKELLPALLKLRRRTGRPHWFVIDEAHQLLPSTWGHASVTLPQELYGLVLITVHPDQVAPVILASVNMVIAIGEAPAQTIRAFSEALQQNPPPVPSAQLRPGEAIAWCRQPETQPFLFRSIPPRTERHRHIRKYAEGEMSDGDVFYFRGPKGKLKLRAQNLMSFIQLAEGVDDETWLYHLRRGDYSHWFRKAVNDQELANETEKIGKMTDMSPQESRALIKAKIAERYTSPA